MKLVWRMADAGWYWRSHIFKQIMLIKSAVPTGAQACIALVKPFLAGTKRTEKLSNWEPVNRAQKQIVLQNPNKINPGGSQDSGVRKLTTTFLLAKRRETKHPSAPQWMLQGTGISSWPLHRCIHWNCWPLTWKSIASMSITNILGRRISFLTFLTLLSRISSIDLK